MPIKPLLAGTLKFIEQAQKYPYACSQKLDGIRSLVLSNQAVSRKLIAIPNRHINKAMSVLPHGIDGEIIIPGRTFNEIQSIVMSFEAEGESEFEFHAFDYVKDSTEKEYLERIEDLKKLELPPFVKLVLPTIVNNSAELEALEEKYVTEGYEGIMLRDPRGKYKCGRSTLKEGILLKYKRFEDSEAVVIGFNEKLKNENELGQDELGHAKRSSSKEHLVPMDTLGSFEVRDIETGIEFSVGSGLNSELAKEIWDNRDKYLGKTISYRYQKSGMKSKPRNPTFRGFRDPRDMSE